MRRILPTLRPSSDLSDCSPSGELSIPVKWIAQHPFTSPLDRPLAACFRFPHSPYSSPMASLSHTSVPTQTLLAVFFFAIVLPTFVSAQGRFPCTRVGGDGTFTADQTQCLSYNLQQGSVAGYQSSRATPQGSTCTIVPESGSYFCGWSGAPYVRLSRSVEAAEQIVLLSPIHVDTLTFAHLTPSCPSLAHLLPAALTTATATTASALEASASTSFLYFLPLA
jgi:hypothetical protein